MSTNAPIYVLANKTDMFNIANSIRILTNTNGQLTTNELVNELVTLAGTGLSSDGDFNTAIIERTENNVTSLEFWFLANAKWNETTNRFQRVNYCKNSFGIQIQASGTYPGEAALGFTGNQAIGFWRAIGKETFQAIGDTTSANALTRDIGISVDGEWKTFGTYLGWNNCQMLDSYGGITIGGQGFEIDGNGLYPYTRVSYSRHEDTAGVDGYAFLGLLWNAYHNLNASDNEALADYALGLKAPIDYTSGSASNNADMTNTSFVIMKRSAGEGHTAADFYPVYELDMNGKLSVNLAKESKIEATVLDDSSAQILYTGDLTQDNAQIKKIIATTASGEITLSLGNVTKTQYGILFGYSGESKANIQKMYAYVANGEKNFDIQLKNLAALEDRISALETNTNAEGGDVNG